MRARALPYFTLFEQPALTWISEPSTLSFFKSPWVGCIKSTRWRLPPGGISKGSVTGGRWARRRNAARRTRARHQQHRAEHHQRPASARGVDALAGPDDADHQGDHRVHVGVARGDRGRDVREQVHVGAERDDRAEETEEDQRQRCARRRRRRDVLAQREAHEQHRRSPAQHLGGGPHHHRGGQRHALARHRAERPAEWREQRHECAGRARAELGSQIHQEDADQAEQHAGDLCSGEARAQDSLDHRRPERHRRHHHRRHARRERLLRRSDQAVADDEEQHAGERRRLPLDRTRQGFPTKPRHQEQQRAGTEEPEGPHQEGREALEREPHPEIGRTPDQTHRQKSQDQQRSLPHDERESASPGQTGTDAAIAG